MVSSRENLSLYVLSSTVGSNNKSKQVLHSDLLKKDTTSSVNGRRAYMALVRTGEATTGFPKNFGV